VAATLKNVYDVITVSRMHRFGRNLAGRCRMTCRWLRKRENQTESRIPVWRPFVYRKEVVISQPQIEISRRNWSAGKLRPS